MKFFLILLLMNLVLFGPVFGQVDSICFEQFALNFFRDSIAKDAYCIKFCGQSDTSKTVLVNSCFTYSTVEDQDINDYLEKEKEELLDMYLNNDYSCLVNHSGVVPLTFNEPPKKCNLFRRTHKLQVMQHIHIAEKACVLIRLSRNYITFDDYYFIMDLKGNVILYCKTSTIKGVYIVNPPIVRTAPSKTNP